MAAALAQALGRPVRFVHDCLDPSRAEAAAGELLLLENLRFYTGEKADDPEFAAQLTAPFSHYVNDAFGTAHRAHASVVAAPALYPVGRKAAGFLMAAEVAALSRVVNDPEQPYVAVVGGAKVSTKTAPLEACWDGSGPSSSAVEWPTPSFSPRASRSGVHWSKRRWSRPL